MLSKTILSKTILSKTILSKTSLSTTSLFSVVKSIFSNIILSSYSDLDSFSVVFLFKRSRKKRFSLLIYSDSLL
jgi:hypothetical protein